MLFTYRLWSDTLSVCSYFAIIVPAAGVINRVLSHRYSSLLPTLCRAKSRPFVNNRWSNYTYMMLSSYPQNCMLSKQLTDWSFSPNSLLCLPLDTIKENYVRGHVKNAVFSEVTPTPLKTMPLLVAVSESALINILDMDPEISKTSEFAEFVAGNRVLPSSTPLAHRYGGHQFGVWASQLGDGRAILLGEYRNRAGERWELQLKGSGLTPYSRGGDGRAVLRSSVREFLCAEAMHYLGVPTSRVAALVTSGDGVVRDPYYRGQPIVERASVVLRLSPTWLRIGSLEIHTRLGEMQSLRAVVSYALETLFPEEWTAANKSLGEGCVRLGARVAELCYKTWVHWQRVGFTHGVLNSDNVSLLGVTIDYGPFGFMPAYDPRFVPNSSDSEGRYCYERQLDAVYFDLEKLRSSLEALIMSGMVPEEASERSGLVQRLAREFNDARLKAEAELNLAFLGKLGLCEPSEANLQLPSMLLLAMEEQGADFTATFRQLGEIPMSQLTNSSEVQKHWALKEVSGSPLWPLFVQRYSTALEVEKANDSDRQAKMNSVNPCYVLRNWIAQQAIEKAEKDDFSWVQRLERILQRPYERQVEAEGLGYGGPSPEWEQDLKVSCSS